MAFSIGDRVVLANGRHDEVYTIRKVNPAKGYKLRTAGGEKYSFWWGDDELAAAVPEIDATLYEASFLTSYFGRVIVGQIYGDKKGRFPDGALVSTSPVIEELDGGIVRTRKSVYKMELGPHPKARKFKPGDWVKTTAGSVGIVFHDDGDPEDYDPYVVGLVERGFSGTYSASELVPYLPS